MLSWEAVKLREINTEFIYKGQSHRSKSLMILCYLFLFWLFPGTEAYCHVLKPFPNFVTLLYQTRLGWGTVKYKLSPKVKAGYRPGNRTTCSLSQIFVHFVNASSSSLWTNIANTCLKMFLEFLRVDTLNMHAIKPFRHFPSVLAYYNISLVHFA